jgi:hypothetical protein
MRDVAADGAEAQPHIRRRENVRGRQHLPSWAPTAYRGVVGGRDHAGRPVSQSRANCISSGAADITAYSAEISVFFSGKKECYRKEIEPDDMVIVSCSADGRKEWLPAQPASVLPMPGETAHTRQAFWPACHPDGKAEASRS